MKKIFNVFFLTGLTLILLVFSSTAIAGSSCIVTNEREITGSSFRQLVDTYNVGSEGVCSVPATWMDTGHGFKAAIYFLTYEWDKYGNTTTGVPDNVINYRWHSNYVDDDANADGIADDNDVADHKMIKLSASRGPINFNNSHGLPIVVGNWGPLVNNVCTTWDFDGSDLCSVYDYGYTYIDASEVSKPFEEGRNQNAAILVRSMVFKLKDGSAITSVSDFGKHFFDGGNNYFCAGEVDLTRTPGAFGWCNPSVIIDPLDEDADGDNYTPNEGDCDDNNANIFPDALEICNDQVDDNCDGIVDNCPDTDADADGYYVDSDGNGRLYDATGAEVTTAEDCNDNNISIHPGATEICDQVDNDCDTQADEGLSCTGSDVDADGDGFYVDGTDADSLCNGTTRCDCDDSNPNLTSNCTGTDADNDGDGVYTDGDGDGKCNGTNVCDCDDNDDDIHPGAAETCDDEDNDCDGAVDDGLMCGGGTGAVDTDDDGDGYCESSVACSDGAEPGDCNDANASVHPNAMEICSNDINEDCDAETDETDCSTRDPGDPTVDNDGDGFCESFTACTDGSQTGDCDDTNAAINPGVDEMTGNACREGVDFNCDGISCSDNTGPSWMWDFPLAGGCSLEQKPSARFASENIFGIVMLLTLLFLRRSVSSIRK